MSLTVGSSSSTYLSSLFSKLDLDSDGKINKTEFVTAAPSGVSETQAASLFDRLDSSGSGALSASDLATAFQKLASQTQAVLIQAQGAGGRSNPAAKFAELDTDDDGKVSRDEFIAGRPEGVSEDEASAFFDQIAASAGASGAESLSEAQVAAGLEANAPAGGPPPGGPPADGVAGSETDSDNDGIPDSQDSTPYGESDLAMTTDELLAKLESAITGDQSGTTSGLLQEFLNAIDHYKKSASATGANDGLTQSLLSIAA